MLPGRGDVVDALWPHHPRGIAAAIVRVCGQLGQPLADQLHRDEIAGGVGALEDVARGGLGELQPQHGADRRPRGGPIGHAFAIVWSVGPAGFWLQ